MPRTPVTMTQLIKSIMELEMKISNAIIVARTYCVCMGMRSTLLSMPTRAKVKLILPVCSCIADPPIVIGVIPERQRREEQTCWLAGWLARCPAGWLAAEAALKDDVGWFAGWLAADRLPPRSLAC